VSETADRGQGLDWTARRDKGPVRSVNEDRWLVGALGERAHLYAVADGMGGSASGEPSARLALEGLYRSLMTSEAPLSVEAQLRAPDDIRATLAAELLKEENPFGLEHGGATLAWAVVRRRAVTVGWIGDSRVGVIGAGDLRWLTRDHTLVEKMVDSGRITREEALTHPHRNILLRSVGLRGDGAEAGAAEVAEATCWHGERLLLCTDGISRSLTGEAIAALVTDGVDASALVDAAIAAGATDNLAAILVDIQH